MNIEHIRYQGKNLAILVHTYQIKDSLSFFSPEDFPIQAGIHNKPKGHNIPAHEHIPFKQLNIPTQELFYVQKGKIRVGLFYESKKIRDIFMNEGDLIILDTGHDLTFLEKTTLLEVKQGPYRGRENEKREIKE